jgi:protein NRD1
MVSMLYRTHKSLQPQFKVPSLYAFDALARAARDHAKHGFTGDVQSGNSATFLLKLEAVLEGLFQDIMGSSVPEGKVSETCTANFLITLGRSSCVSCPLSQDIG